MTEQIVLAIKYLAGVCDFAASQDGQGFNRFDAPFGHSLAEQIVAGSTLSEGQLSAARKMLTKYQSQLARAGITLPSSAEVETEVKKQNPTAPANLIKVMVQDSNILISFPGKPAPELLEKIRALRVRRWNPDLPGKPWVVPISDQVNVLAIFQDVPGVEIAPELTSEQPSQKNTAPQGGIILTLENGEIAIRFPGRPAPEDLSKVKALPERRWNPKGEGMPWIAPTRLLADIIAAFPDAHLDPALKKISNEQKTLSAMSRKAESDFDVPGLRLPLLPYQRAGVQFLETAGGRAIIADEMGLGKTCQSLAYLQLHPEFRPAVIVVPATLKLNWRREISKFMSTDERVAILSGTKAHDIELGASIVIINYDILADWLEKIIEFQPAIVIYDEAHYLKNSKSQRGKAGKALAGKVQKTICLTGTPITNRPAELFPLLNMIDGKAWKDFFRFAQQYCGAERTRFGWDFSGASNLDDLHERIKPWIVRRVKSDVLTELPEKRHATVIVEFDPRQRQQYNAVMDGMIKVIKNSEASKNPVNALAEIERAKQAAVYAKLPAAIDWIENFLDTNGKLVVFATHQFVIDALMSKFQDRAVKVTGEVTGEQRQKAVDDFQNNSAIRLFVGNIKAAGVGITLTAASDVAFIEFPWTPGDLAQATDRCHRIGQKASVTAWYLVADETFEETIVDLLQTKSQVIGQAIDGNPGAMNLNILGELMERLNK